MFSVTANPDGYYWADGFLSSVLVFTIFGVSACLLDLIVLLFYKHLESVTVYASTVAGW